MNILLLSVGTRNKIIQYFKREIGENGKIIATDMVNIAPAAYEADVFYRVPPIRTDGYIDIILDICKKERVSAVLSLIDIELSLLAKNEARFAELGVKVIGSSYELCEMSLDKIQMHTFLEKHGYKSAMTYADKAAFYRDLKDGKISFPVFVKPFDGSASVDSYKVSDEESLEILWKHTDDLMIQEYMHGEEYGADCYIDMLSGELVSVFVKKKLLMRAGETQKAISVKDDRLFELIENFVNKCGFRGQIDIDIFDVDGEYYISEVNPRFGGGYPHAYECGCNHMKLIVNNVKGIVNEKNIGAYDEGVYMMKYYDLLIKKELEI